MSKDYMDWFILNIAPWLSMILIFCVGIWIGVDMAECANVCTSGTVEIR
jgi:hypothetical protein